MNPTSRVPYGLAPYGICLKPMTSGRVLPSNRHPKPTANFERAVRYPIDVLNLKVKAGTPRLDFLSFQSDGNFNVTLPSPQCWWENYSPLPASCLLRRKPLRPAKQIRFRIRNFTVLMIPTMSGIGPRKAHWITR